MNIDYSAQFPWGGKAGFEEKIISGEKVHTIRSYNRGVKLGSYISHGKKTGGSRYSRTQFLLNKSTGFQPIEIKFKDKKIIYIKIDGKEVGLSEVAKNDGLTPHEFERWFYRYQENSVFNGFVIHWTDLRY